MSWVFDRRNREVYREILHDSRVMSFTSPMQRDFRTFNQHSFRPFIFTRSPKPVPKVLYHALPNIRWVNQEVFFVCVCFPEIGTTSSRPLQGSETEESCRHHNTRPHRAWYVHVRGDWCVTLNIPCSCCSLLTLIVILFHPSSDVWTCAPAVSPCSLLTKLTEASSV